MKKLKAISHDTICIKNNPVTWCDVWTEYTDRPNRRKVKHAFTVIGLLDLQSDIHFESLFLKNHPDWKETEKSLAEFLDIQNQLKSVEFVINVVEEPWNINIYINKNYFTRDDVDRALDFFMKSRGFRGAEVKWRRPPSFIVQTVTPGVSDD